MVLYLIRKNSAIGDINLREGEVSPSAAHGCGLPPLTGNPSKACSPRNAPLRRKAIASSKKKPSSTQVSLSLKIAYAIFLTTLRFLRYFPAQSRSCSLAGLLEVIVIVFKQKKAQQLPTFPLKSSIIGVRELDFRVRNGNGYYLSTMATGIINNAIYEVRKTINRARRTDN